MAELEVVLYPPYSVLMSVYIKEKAEYLSQAIDSMYSQTVAPDEIVIVEDGPLTDELYAVLDKYSQNFPESFKRVRSIENEGLGKSLCKGLSACSNAFVARMDTDDISKSDRCEKQLKQFIENPEIDVVGASIEEFFDVPENVISERIVPVAHEDICKYMKYRNPFNHPSVMYRKQSVIDAGSYMDLYLYEDYYLWVRMYLNGCKFANINECLVSMRTNDMSARRGGYKYFKSEKTLFKFMRKNKIIGRFAYTKAIVIRFIARVMMPNGLRRKLYNKFLRQNKI